ncbi:MAG: tRNA (adenosine(37)-N6)-threonylcarbamoyltransferase complex dimerization subunit type 1 TsaB [Deltaproteobacteria bacterium]|jgi:tRNA threonylcarbamoyladenosine biosynthesis protein TsaB|nr:tRNA (adenosine(37)-N6)-threonylcarbamoyltransferase complex dimerization subunit type 1 TsaB [Deltaproteobacteria bacterium]
MDLLVLSLDTSTSLATLGLSRHGALGQIETLESLVVTGQGGHSGTLPPQIDALLKRHSLKAADLNLIAAGRGPGSFTGLRTGLALAKGLALGAGVPALGVPSLAALAWGGNVLGSGQNDSPFLAPVIDARHGEVFTRLYEPKNACPWPEALSEILVLSPEKIMPALKPLDARGRGIVLLGPALSFLPPPQAGFTHGPAAAPDPIALAAQAVWALAQNLGQECPLAPLYGRSPDIFKKWTPPTRLTCREP